MSSPSHPVPPPPALLSAGTITLRFDKYERGYPNFDLAPSYHYEILDREATAVGRISFRLGDSPHVMLYAGHIGYEIAEGHRGHSYAYHACRALAPFVRSVCESVIITADPENTASLRTIEKLQASFLEEVPIPPGDPHYLQGSRFKRRYHWRP